MKYENLESETHTLYRVLSVSYEYGHEHKFTYIQSVVLGILFRVNKNEYAAAVERLINRKGRQA